MSSANPHRMGRLPPTSESLLDEDTKPYFLWWTGATVGQLKEHLVSSDPEERAYWMAALLREANTRDVWLFVSADEIRELWTRLIRYLGRSRQMWAWLLELPPPEWPPLSQIRAELKRMQNRSELALDAPQSDTRVPTSMKAAEDHDGL